MTPIRPNGTPFPAAGTAGRPAVGVPGQDAGKMEAQRAFFEALNQKRDALGGARPGPATDAAPVQKSAQPAPAATSNAVASAARAAAFRTPAPPTEAPQKILRPGSLIDIRV